MINLNPFKTKKGQGMPLNVIVIAILVVIVLVVIVVFFVGKFNESSSTIDKQSASSCDLSNPAINALSYTDAKPLEDPDSTCAEEYGEEYSKFMGLSNCCVTK